MNGLQKICKLYSSMTINGVKHVWDYAADKAVKESEMPIGIERHKASERAKWATGQVSTPSITKLSNNDWDNRTARLVRSPVQ